MEIKKTDIVQIRKEDFLELIESCDSKQVEEEMKSKYPKAFESEYRECYLMTNAPNRANELPSLGAEVETGNWKLFDGGNSFYVVHKDLTWAIEFVKDGNWDRAFITMHPDSDILTYLKERK